MYRLGDESSCNLGREYGNLEVEIILNIKLQHTVGSP